MHEKYKVSSSPLKSRDDLNPEGITSLSPVVSKSELWGATGIV